SSLDKNIRTFSPGKSRRSTAGDKPHDALSAISAWGREDLMATGKSGGLITLNLTKTSQNCQMNCFAEIEEVRRSNPSATTSPAFNGPNFADPEIGRLTAAS